MSIMDFTTVTVPRRRQVKQGFFEFRLTYWLVFAIFLSGAIAHRIIPYRWRPKLVPDNVRRSVIEEAKVATNNSVPFAF